MLLPEGGLRRRRRGGSSAKLENQPGEEQLDFRETGSGRSQTWQSGDGVKWVKHTFFLKVKLLV